MWQQIKHSVLFVAIIAVLILSVADTSRAQASLTTKTGSLSDGATYLMRSSLQLERNPVSL